MDVLQQTVNYEVYVNGSRYLGTASVDLPEFNYMTNEIKGAGIAGQMDVPTLAHVENLEVTLHWRNIHTRPTELLNQDAVMLTLRSAVQLYDAASGINKISAVKIELRALSAGLTLGKLEPGEQAESESKFNCDFVKITVDGAVKMEHDTFNFVHVVDGVDLMARVRPALGL